MTKEEVLEILKENLFIHHSVDGEIYHECTCCSVISKTYQHLEGCDVQKVINDIEVVYNIVSLYNIIEDYSRMSFDRFNFNFCSSEENNSYPNYIYKVSYPPSQTPDKDSTGWFPFNTEKDW